MNTGDEFFLNIIIAAIFGAITAAIASSKGRNVVGWFFLGFFFSCIGLIIILCLSNLREEEARHQALELGQRRLREQLRQEQLQNEALRRHAVARLDLHDQQLGMDTRQGAPPLYPAGTLPPPLLGDGGGSLGSEFPPPGYPATQWHLCRRGERSGPFTYAELHRRAMHGTLGAEDLVWVEGMEQWQPARLIPNLIPS
jgi:hypothetical protein